MFTHNGEPINFINMIASMIATILLWLLELKIGWATGFWLFGSDLGAATTAICLFIALNPKNSLIFR